VALDLAGDFLEHGYLRLVRLANLHPVQDALKPARALAARGALAARLVLVEVGEAADGGDGVDTLNLGGEGWVQGASGDWATYSALGTTLYVRGFESVVIAATIGPNDQLLIGEDFAETIQGFDGNDTILGLGGNDTLDGGEHNDSLVGGTGDDSMLGGNGADTLFGDAGADRMFGGNGADSLLAGDDYGQRLYGEAGNDTLVLGGGNDQLALGGDGNDSLIGGTGDIQSL
jgi:Ca2+-binding RTX toxin-like protein